MDKERGKLYFLNHQQFIIFDLDNNMIEATINNDAANAEELMHIFNRIDHVQTVSEFNADQCLKIALYCNTGDSENRIRFRLQYVEIIYNTENPKNSNISISEIIDDDVLSKWDKFYSNCFYSKDLQRIYAFEGLRSDNLSMLRIWYRKSDREWVKCMDFIAKPQCLFQPKIIFIKDNLVLIFDGLLVYCVDLMDNTYAKHEKAMDPSCTDYTDKNRKNDMCYDEQNELIYFHDCSRWSDGDSSILCIDVNELIPMDMRKSIIISGFVRVFECGTQSFIPTSLIVVIAHFLTFC